MFRTVVPYLCCGAGLAPWLAAQQEPDPRLQALERAVQQSTPEAPAGEALAPPVPGQLRLCDLSLDIRAAAGASTARDRVLRGLQGGGHDPRQRGFTLQQAELSLSGAVDPYFTAQVHLVALLDAEENETVVELEEAFLTTQALPYDLQLRAGTFLTGFGRLNPVHAHACDWLDQPLILTRVLGGDGMRGPGARLSWLLPTDTYTELLVGIQDASGEGMRSFLANAEVYGERPIGGRSFTGREVRSFGDFVFSGRLATSVDLSSNSSFGLGGSWALGPNATGGGAETLIWGADFVYKWRPTEQRGWPYVTVQGEFVGRAFDAAAQVDEQDPLNPVAVPQDTLRDHGGYLQALWGFTPGWEVGVRGEWASGSGASYDPGSQTFARGNDPFRADRHRLSPLLAYRPSEFARIRLQYDYDDGDALAEPVHSVWLGFEVLIGKHAAHTY